MIDFKDEKYTRKEIESRLLSQVSNSIDKRQGSIIQTALGPVAWYLEGLYMLLEQVQENAYAGSAVGEFLDRIVAERGLTRKASTPAIRKGIFDVEVPSGSIFKTINGANSVIFEVGEQISAQEGEYVYSLSCQTAGIIGNSYFGNILPVTAVAGLKSAVIGEVIVSGSEEETDASLRARFFETFDVAAFGGNIAAYRNAILAIDGVGAVQVYPAWKGGGTVLCSILDSELTPAEPGLISKVQATICPTEANEEVASANGYGIAPIGASVTITTAINLVLNISATIQFAATVQSGVEIYQKEIEQKIQKYLKSVCESWGSAIKSQKISYVVAVYSSRIVAAILEIPNVVNVTDVMINGASGDLILTETAELQQIPSLGVVTING